MNIWIYLFIEKVKFWLNKSLEGEGGTLIFLILSLRHLFNLKKSRNFRSLKWWFRASRRDKGMRFFIFKFTSLLYYLFFLFLHMNFSSLTWPVDKSLRSWFEISFIQFEKSFEIIVVNINWVYLDHIFNLINDFKNAEYVWCWLCF